MDFKKNYRSFNTATFALFLTLLFGRGADAISVSTTPYVNVSVDAGEDGEVTIPVRNPGSVPIQVSTEVFDYSQTAKGPTFPTAGSYRWGAGAWIETTPRSFTLLPGNEQGVKIRFRVPKGVQTHSYSSVIFFRAQPAIEAETPQNNAFARVTGKVGSLVFLQVKGTEEARVSGDILSFSTPRILFAPPGNFTVSYRNTGNIHSRIEGLISLNPVTGFEKTTQVTLPPRWIMPGSEILLQGQLMDLPLFGVFRAAVLLHGSSGEVAQTADNRVIVIVSWPLLAGLLLISAGALAITKLLALTVHRDSAAGLERR